MEPVPENEGAVVAGVQNAVSSSGAEPIPESEGAGVAGIHAAAQAGSSGVPQAEETGPAGASVPKEKRLRRITIAPWGRESPDSAYIGSEGEDLCRDEPMREGSTCKLLVYGG